MLNFVNDILHFCNISVEYCSPIVPRQVDYYDFTFVLDGEMVFITQGKTYTLKKNDAILLPPNREHQRLEGKTPVKYVSFNFTKNENAEFPQDIFLRGVISSEIRKLIAAFPHSHLSPYYNSKEKCANILNYILLDILSGEAPRSNNEHIDKIIRYTDENITQKLSLASISKEVNLSREYLCELFKKETGKNLTDYINERKIYVAKELILSGKMSLSQVASYVGYSDYTYFSRLFKKYFDITPITLKNNNK